MLFKKITTLIAGTALLTGAGVSGISYAAGGVTGDYKMEKVDWSFYGARGTFDVASAQRGYKVYREVCASCHALDHLAFRNLGDKGAPFYDENYPNPNDNPIVKAFAADWLVQDIDSETGDVIERPAVPADEFPPIYPNNAAARASNGGALPPDLSLMVAARTGGADYVYNLLLAYDAEKPEDFDMTPGLYYNPVMEGGAIAMSAPLTEDILVEYDPIEMVVDDHGEEKIVTVQPPEATVAQNAYDVTNFLAWSADPKLEERKRAGFATLIYLSLFAILMWLSYKRVWRNVEH